MKKETHVYKPVGLPPGSVVYEGKKRNTDIKIHLMEYCELELIEREVSIEECSSLSKSDNVKWVNVTGIHRTDIIEKFGDIFKIHSLTLEDVVNTNSRPKFEEFNSYIVSILKMLTYPDKVKSEHLSIILAEHNIVISFQEKPGDVFDFVRARIRNSKGRIRKVGSDYLAYCLLDAVVDNYFLILEKIGDKIEVIEEELISNPNKETMTKLHYMKREMISLRKSIWPLRELIGNLDRSESELIRSMTRPFLRDLYDHTVRIIDTVETQRDLLSGMMDIYLSSTSNRTNEIMKVLTIITTIFVPITFIVGVYGMNFEIPEVKSSWGYPIVWLVMITITGFLLHYFRKKKWL